MEETKRNPLHRGFSLLWVDWFDETSAFEVRPELDLSIKKQLLDLVIVRKDPSFVPKNLPTGFEDLANHNLITFKSHQETLDDGTMREFMSHFVSYQKIASHGMKELVRKSEFKLFAVSARFPQKLESQITLTPLMPGVYNTNAFAMDFRIIVLNDLPLEPKNAMLHLFSANPNNIRYAAEHYRQKSAETSTLIREIFKIYSEDQDMDIRLKEFARESRENFIKELTPEERLKGLPAEERLKGLPAEERLKGLPAEERLKGLSAEEMAKSMTPETLEAFEEFIRQNRQRLFPNRPNGESANSIS